jgi:hypothetical protein
VINSLEEGAEAVELCNDPSVWLLSDYYHMLKEGEPATEIVTYGHLISRSLKTEQGSIDEGLRR